MGVWTKESHAEACIFAQLPVRYHVRYVSNGLDGKESARSACARPPMAQSPSAMEPHKELSELPMAELEACVEACMMSASTSSLFDPRTHPEHEWVTFEADVRNAASVAVDRLRAQPSEPSELLRLCMFEEQTRCQAFQAAMMGEVGPAVYQAAVRSIIEKLLRKLELYAPDPSLYQAAAQCLSEYMSALNHHCDICAVPRSTAPLPAIAEGREASVDPSLYGLDSSDYPSELGSEDAETLSVHSETVSDHSNNLRAYGHVAAPRPSGSEDGSFSLGFTPGSMSEDQLRKERRRESNKKASVKYRSKKSSSMQQVLADCSAARQQVASLSSQNAVLTAENQLLKQQVEFLQNMLQGRQPAETPSSSAAPPAQQQAVAALNGSDLLDLVGDAQLHL